MSFHWSNHEFAILECGNRDRISIWQTEQRRKASLAKSRIATPRGTMALEIGPESKKEESMKKPTAMPKPEVAPVAQVPSALITRQPKEEEEYRWLKGEFPEHDAMLDAEGKQPATGTDGSKEVVHHGALHCPVGKSIPLADCLT